MPQPFSLPPPKTYVSGTWHKPDCIEQSASTLEQIEAALESAHNLHQMGTWDEDANARADALESIAAYLALPERLEAIAVADSITTGVVIGVSRRLAYLLPSMFFGAARVIREGDLSQVGDGPLGAVRYFRRAWGPALLISPWNAPTLIGAHKLASALAAGAPAIVKPSIWTPHSALMMFEAIDALGLPVGAASLLMGDRNAITPALHDARVQAVSFTGGLNGGRAIAKACAANFKPTQLELGGNNALVVLACADLDAAAAGIVFGLANLNGQWCRAIGRVIVDARIKTKLLDLVLEKLATLKLGDALDDTSDMGPQAHVRQWQDLHIALDALTTKGGTPFRATPIPKRDGHFFPPTLVDGCAPCDTRHEIFGPIATLHSFDTEAQALALANDPPFGLAGYVYGQEARALAFGARMRTGGVKVNGIGLSALRGDFPRGAWGLSGLGEEGRYESVAFFTGARVIGVSPQEVLGS